MNTFTKKVKREDYAYVVDKKPRYEPIVKKFLVTTTSDCRFIKKIEFEFDHAQSCDDLFQFPFALPTPEYQVDIEPKWIESTSKDTDPSLNFDEYIFDEFSFI